MSLCYGREECFETHLSHSDSLITTQALFVLLLQMESRDLSKVSHIGSCLGNSMIIKWSLPSVFAQDLPLKMPKSILMTVILAQLNKNTMAQKLRTEVTDGQEKCQISYYYQQDEE